MKVVTMLVSLVLLQQAPRKVTNAFEQKYPSAEGVSWSHFDNYYEASFEHFGQQKNAIYMQNGIWLKTLIIIEPGRLMYCIRDYIKHTYKDARVGYAYYVITDEVCEYHVYLERGEGEEVCLEEEPLIFDENCEFLRNNQNP